MKTEEGSYKFAPHISDACKYVERGVDIFTAYIRLSSILLILPSNLNMLENLADSSLRFRIAFYYLTEFAQVL